MKISKKWRVVCLMLSMLMLLSSCQGGKKEALTTQAPESTSPETEPITEAVTKETLDLTKLSTYNDYASEAIERLCNVFWDTEGNYFIRTAKGQPSPDAVAIWEQGQSIFALISYYDATKNEAALQKLNQQWAYLTSSAYDEQILRGYKNIGEGCYYAQDDAAWGTLVFMGLYRTTGNEKAMEYAHDLIVNSYNHWGTGEEKSYYGTTIKSLTDGLYYTDHLNEGEAPFKSIYAAPMAVAALEYCLLKNPSDPTAVDLYEPTRNLFEWLENNMCRNKVKTYKNYDANGNCTVSYVDYLYYVDYGRNGENGPTGARDPQSIAVNSSNTALFGNMAMASCAAILYQITQDTKYSDIAVRTVKAITKTETHDTSKTYINDRDQGTNASMIGHFVRYALALDGVRLSDKQVLINTAEIIATKGKVNGTDYYYTVWDSDPASHTVYYPNNSRVYAYTCQPRMANCVHVVTAALLLLSLE
ncbi:MAG: hypothetical protein J6B71_00620 [Clostridia bacterium]|nr:hypothetical protein [Clostridia bacterium]